MIYRLQFGIRHEEDNSVSAENAFGDIDYGPTYDDALYSLVRAVKGDLHQINGGLFKHLPGVEGVFVEEWREGKEDKDRVWLIRRLTTESQHRSVDNNRHRCDNKLKNGERLNVQQG